MKINRRISLHSIMGLLLGSLIAGSSQARFVEDIQVPFERFVLDNGLTLLVHEDRKAPIVTVNVWYHVGSKNERPGITGFAHLFEHLMFNGSENYQGEWFLPLEKAGGTDLNGTTWFDRTNYFQTVPTPALDLVLWMESDRMGHFLGAITQEGLDEQRSVVQNEKRQGDNRPYGTAGYIQLKGMFPEGHPYRWSTIGSMEDLNAASLEDVREWFETYYGASNAVLVVAGDISPETALKKVERYFGDIAPGPALTKPERWVAQRSENTRDIMYDEVALARLTQSWNTAPFGDEDAVYLDLAARILAGGRSSRLYQRLVYEDQIASSVAAVQIPLEIAGIFEIEAYVKSGVDLRDVEAAIEEELQDFLSSGPTRSELEAVRTSYFATLIRGLEKTGGFAGKAQLLATYETYLGDAGKFTDTLATYERATVQDIREASARWLSAGRYSLEVLPRPRFSVAKSGVDRSRMPGPGPAPELDFPDIQTYVLDNGIEVLHAQRGELPVVSVNALFDAGYAADDSDKQGLAALMSAMLSEGSRDYDSLEFARRAEELGAVFSASASLDSNSVSLSALNQNIEESLELFADALAYPAFDAVDLDRVRSNWLDRIAREKTDPRSLALRNLPPLLYGEGHPYSIPFTGSGTEQTVKSITLDDLRNFHQNWIRPDNARILVVGNFPPAEFAELLNKNLGAWTAPDSEISRKVLTSVEPADETLIYLLDRPGSPQSVVIGGHLLPSTLDEDNIALDMAVRILGGNFNARLNMNLREDKGWAYGARASASNALGQRPLIYYAPVQIDRTLDSLREIIREAEEYVDQNPVREKELARSKDGILRSLPGRYETNGAVARTLAEMVHYQRPLDYVEQYQTKMESLGLEEVRDAARQYIMPAKTVWLIVGDLKEIEQPLRDSGIAEIRVISATGDDQQAPESDRSFQEYAESASDD